MLPSATVLALVAGASFAGDLHAGPVAPAPQCEGFQRCADHCIPWTAVCRDTLAESVGLTPPPVTPGPSATDLPRNTPAGSTLLALPALREAGRPAMRPGGPAFCYDGKTTKDISIQLACIPYYSGGMAAASAPGPGLLSDCPQHRRCGGECIAETESCTVVPAERDTDRLTPFEP